MMHDLASEVMIADSVALKSKPVFGAIPKKRGRKKKPTNPSGIHPTEFNILVRPDKAEEVTKGGIIVPTEALDKQESASQTGIIIEVSPLAFGYEVWPEGARKPQIGDRVIFAKYAGFLRDGKDGDKYRIMKDKDVVAMCD